MRVNYAGLGDQAKEPFWRFISCCLSSSPEVLSSGPDLSDLSIQFKLNGLDVDLLKAWKLYDSYSPPESTVNERTEGADENQPANPTAGLNVSSLIHELQGLRGRIEEQMSDLDSAFDNAVDYAASAAADVAADYARERVHEEAHENGPGFGYAGEQLMECLDDIISGLEDNS